MSARAKHPPPPDSEPLHQAFECEDHLHLRLRQVEAIAEAMGAASTSDWPLCDEHCVTLCLLIVTLVGDARTAVTRLCELRMAARAAGAGT